MKSTVQINCKWHQWNILHFFPVCFIKAEVANTLEQTQLLPSLNSAYWGGFLSHLDARSSPICETFRTIQGLYLGVGMYIWAGPLRETCQKN